MAIEPAGIGGRQLTEEEMMQQPAGQPAAPQPAPEAQAPVQPEVQEEEEEEGNILDGVSNFLEDQSVNIRDWVDDTFQGDQLSRDEIVENRQELKEEQRQFNKETEEGFYDTAAGTVAAEGVRAVAGGLAQAVETAGETAELAGDALKGAVGLSGDEAAPWEANYEWADWDLGVAENRTLVGNFARETVAVLAGMRGLRAAGVGVGSQTAGQRLASETLRGALYDFFSEPGEGNLSNLVQDSRFANPLSKALAHEDDDNPWIRKLKNMVEGGTIGVAVDGLGELYTALRAGKKAQAAGKSPEEAMEASLNALYHGTDQADAIKRTGFRVSAGESDSLGRGVYMTRDRSLANAYGKEILEGSDEGLRIKELTIDEMEEVYSRYGGMNEMGGPADVDALKKEFGEEFDAVSVKGLYDDKPDLDEVLIFEATRADEITGRPLILDPNERLTKRTQTLKNGTKVGWYYSPTHTSTRPCMTCPGTSMAKASWTVAVKP